jgi:hypothetical protein
MFCKDCGFELPTNSVACSACGVQIIRQVELVPVQTQPNNADMMKAMLDFQASQQTKTEPVKPIVIVNKGSTTSVEGFIGALAFVALLCVGGWFGYQYLQKQDDTWFNFSIGKNGVNTSVKLPKFEQSQQRQATNQTTQSVSNTYSKTDSEQAVEVEGEECTLIGNTPTIYYRADCENYDCVNDKDTIAGSLRRGNKVIKIDEPEIPTNIGFSWIPIEVNGYQYYVASTKIRCE